jgi:hypothetical protein
MKKNEEQKETAVCRCCVCGKHTKKAIIRERGEWERQNKRENCK